MLRCAEESKLIHLLENLGKDANLDQNRLQPEETSLVHQCSVNEDRMDTLSAEGEAVERRIVLVDGMVLVQNIKKSTAMVTVADHSFNELLMSPTRGSDEIIVVFDTYKKSSLKYATREARRQYQIHDDTHPTYEAASLMTRQMLT